MSKKTGLIGLNKIDFTFSPARSPRAPQFQTTCLVSQEWKSGQHKTLGPVRAYEPKPPEPVGKDVDPAKFPLRLVKLNYDSSPSAKGWQKFRVSLPPAVRARHVDDPVFGEAWKDLLRDFDAKLFVLK